MAVNATSAIDDRIRKAAEDLTGSDVRAISAATSGANSSVYRVETPAGVFALKSYPTRSNDTRSRADIEWRALRFLASRGVTAVPSALARDSAGQFMLMEWIDGVAIKSHTAAEVSEAADFIVRIFELSSDPEAAHFPLASEACLSADSIVRQIEQRLPSIAPPPALAPFLSGEFLAALAGAKDNVSAELRQPVELASGLRRLIPADFGFHNAVRQADRTRYVDFEYFGWDDPVKVTADFLLHPAMQLSADDNSHFLLRIYTAQSPDRDFPARLQRLLPLFALRWILILFNPFRHDRIGELPGDQDARQSLLADRLTKVERLLPWTDPKTVAARIAP
jgi:hypothetical protein